MRLKSFLSIVLTFVVFSNFIFPKEVNVYTSRHYDSDIELYDKFTDLTGIEVNIISAKSKALIERIRSEGQNSPADVFITCLLYTSPSPRDATLSRMPSSA